MKRFLNFPILALLILPALLILLGCHASKMQEYYSSNDNYVSASGIVTYISYSEDGAALYFEFSDLTPSFDDSCFKIVGRSLLITQERGIDYKIQLGDKVDFITAPKYFGDGYVMPIVSISVNGEQLLSFEEGLPGFLEWLN